MQPSVSKDSGFRVNQEITAQRVRLIDKDGEMLGVVTRQEALRLAQEAGLDLVEISPNAEPPVCKILEYGKFKFEQQKKKHEAKKKQKIIELKEIQLRPMIGENDLQVKCKAIARFIQEGNKVKVTMRFRGREMSNQHLGMQILTRIAEQFEETGKIEVAPKFEGKQIFMIIGPK